MTSGFFGGDCCALPLKQNTGNKNQIETIEQGAVFVKKRVFVPGDIERDYAALSRDSMQNSGCSKPLGFLSRSDFSRTYPLFVSRCPECRGALACLNQADPEPFPPTPRIPKSGPP